MIDQLPMFDPMTSPDTGNAISSLALEAGHTPPASPDGPTTGKSGQARRRASRSASLANSAVPMMTGTYGPTCFASLQAVAPPCSFVSRLQQRLAKVGSTECLLTWKASATPGNRPLYRLVPSTRHTVVTVCGSSQNTEAELWITASARDWKDSPGMATTRPDGRSRIDQLPRQAAAAMWATPTSLAPAKNGNNEAGNSAGLVAIRAHAIAAMWQTPVADDSVDRDRGKYNSRGEPKLSAEVKLAMWPTATASLADKGVRSTAGAIAEAARWHGPDLAAVTAAVPGLAQAGSSATTAKRGASPSLNPAFVCWLMGFPPAWENCAGTAMPSSRKSPPRSSAPGWSAGHE